jgi:hypothetical protein
MLQKQQATPPRRTTHALTGTDQYTRLLLDFPAQLAVLYAQTWLTRAGSLKVPSSGIVRRALALYVRHLEAQAQLGTIGGPVEVRAVAQACKAFEVPSQAQHAALQRLADAPTDAQLPSFLSILQGPEVGAALADFDDRVSALFDLLDRDPYLKGRASRRRNQEARAQQAPSGGTP